MLPQIVVEGVGKGLNKRLYVHMLRDLQYIGTRVEYACVAKAISIADSFPGIDLRQFVQLAWERG